jgi:hypothetical protein
MTYEEWMVEGERRYGPDKMKWRFKCPVCGCVATPEDWKKAGAGEGSIAFSCIGRWIEGSRAAFEGKGKGPCTYAGGGLFGLNPIEVEGERYFDFADDGD